MIFTFFKKEKKVWKFFFFYLQKKDHFTESDFKKKARLELTIVLY